MLISKKYTLHFLIEAYAEVAKNCSFQQLMSSECAYGDVLSQLILLHTQVPT